MDCFENRKQLLRIAPTMKNAFLRHFSITHGRTLQFWPERVCSIFVFSSEISTRAFWHFHSRHRKIYIDKRWLNLLAAIASLQERMVSLIIGFHASLAASSSCTVSCKMSKRPSSVLFVIIIFLFLSCYYDFKHKPSLNLWRHSHTDTKNYKDLN